MKKWILSLWQAPRNTESAVVPLFVNVVVTFKISNEFHIICSEFQEVPDSLFIQAVAALSISDVSFSTVEFSVASRA